MKGKEGKRGTVRACVRVSVRALFLIDVLVLVGRHNVTVHGDAGDGSVKGRAAFVDDADVSPRVGRNLHVRIDRVHLRAQCV